MRRSAALHMQAARPVTRLATNVLRVISLRFQSRMRRRPEVTRDCFVTSFAAFRAFEFSARNLRRSENGAGGCATGNQHKRGGRSTASEPEPIRAPGEELPSYTRKPHERSLGRPRK